MEPNKIAGLDKIVHEKARLMILTYLSSADRAAVGFPELRDALGFTGGNLSVQLRNLEEAGYASIEKSFKDNKSFTAVSLTARGRKALDEYLSDMERLIRALKEKTKP